MAKPNPYLVANMPSVKLGRLGPVGELKIQIVESEGASTDGRFPDDSVEEEDRQEKGISIGHQVISVGFSKSSREALWKNLFSTSNRRDEDFC